jgi:hypothetical protein
MQQFFKTDNKKQASSLFLIPVSLPPPLILVNIDRRGAGRVSEHAHIQKAPVGPCHIILKSSKQPVSHPRLAPATPPRQYR